VGAPLLCVPGLPRVCSEQEDDFPAGVMAGGGPGPFARLPPKLDPRGANGGEAAHRSERL